MRKHRLYVIRKQGDLYRHFSIRFHRDTVTGEYSISLFGFGHMIMVCMEKVIPGLAELAYPYWKYPRLFPCGILAEPGKEFFRRKTFCESHSSDK